MAYKLQLQESGKFTTPQVYSKLLHGMLSVKSKAAYNLWVYNINCYCTHTPVNCNKALMEISQSAQQVLISSFQLQTQDYGITQTTTNRI